MSRNPLKYATVHRTAMKIYTDRRPNPLASYIKQDGYDQTKKVNCGSANRSHNHNIISLLAADEFNVILKITKDDVNVIIYTHTRQMQQIQHKQLAV